ncbi:hypothetical protein SAMN05519103_06193 [Rhizobiales bacterium GAS113]|nr:hypothetical protein SAMN05519103_06193 [Rhizobiales bacterium GAS113]
MKFTAAIFVALSSILVASPVMAQIAGDVFGPAGVVPLATPQADAKVTVDQRSE